MRTPGGTSTRALRIVVAAVALLAGLSTVAAAAAATTAAPGPGPSNGAAGVTAKVIPLANFALPPTTWGCTPRQPNAAGATTVPVVVSRVGTQVAILANLCVDGSAPQPFVVDTGASQSEIDSALAQRLHLPTAGEQQEIEGVGCTGPAQPRTATQLSLEGVRLAPQTMMGVTIPGMGKAGQPVGLLGSDVLSRFGAVRFDFTRAGLTLPGREGPAPQSERTVQGPTSTPTPPTLLRGTTAGAAPATVLSGPGVSELITNVRLGPHHPVPFAVDTGSSQSVVMHSLSKKLDLRVTRTWERQTTVCSTITVRLYRSGPWQVGAVPLTRGAIATVSLGPVRDAGFVGLLGSDQLARFGWVVFDYAGARLVLGAK